jgi:GT2 family glycosyltransferase
MKMDVIIPFHGNTSLLWRCLKALSCSHATGNKIWLVDDGSTADEIARLRQPVSTLSMDIHWITQPFKSGFVNAVNTAWTKCTNEIAVVLNSDTVPPPALLGRIGSIMTSRKSIAAVAPASDNRADLYQYRENISGVSFLTPAPYLTAMCMGIRRSAVNSSRLFDPVFSPGYFEDLDLSCRLRANGWQLVVDEGCRVEHTGRSTFRHEPDLRLLLQRNYSIFSSRWGHLADHTSLVELLHTVDH